MKATRVPSADPDVLVYRYRRGPLGVLSGVFLLVFGMTFVALLLFSETAWSGPLASRLSPLLTFIALVVASIPVVLGATVFIGSAGLVVDRRAKQVKAWLRFAPGWKRSYTMAFTDVLAVIVFVGGRHHSMALHCSTPKPLEGGLEYFFPLQYRLESDVRAAAGEMAGFLGVAVKEESRHD